MGTHTPAAIISHPFLSSLTSAPLSGRVCGCQAFHCHLSLCLSQELLFQTVPTLTPSPLLLFLSFYSSFLYFTLDFIFFSPYTSTPCLPLFCFFISPGMMMDTEAVGTQEDKGCLAFSRWQSFSICLGHTHLPPKHKAPHWC